MEKLPEKIIDIEVVRINRNIDKRCTCRDRNFIVDSQNKEINCGTCGARVDSYEALEEVASSYERLGDEVRHLLKQRKQIMNYKPHLIVFRDLESKYRGKKMLPICPHCHRAFYFEELNAWTSRELEDKRRARESEG